MKRSSAHVIVTFTCHVTQRVSHLPPPRDDIITIISANQCPQTTCRSIRCLVYTSSSLRPPLSGFTTLWFVYPSSPNTSASKPGAIASRCLPSTPPNLRTARPPSRVRVSSRSTDLLPGIVASPTRRVLGLLVDSIPRWLIYTLTPWRERLWLD